MPKVKAKTPRPSNPTPASAEIPLPPLLEDALGVDITITTIRVSPRPQLGGARGMTWTAEEQPAIRLAKGAYVVLRTGTQMSGVGKLSQAADLRRHWISFAISGGDQPCNMIRIPIPWATLDTFEGYTHFTRYFNLPSLPPPHALFRHREEFQNDKINPYRPEGWPVDNLKRDMEQRLARIANVHPRNVSPLTPY